MKRRRGFYINLLQDEKEKRPKLNLLQDKKEERPAPNLL